MKCKNGTKKPRVGKKMSGISPKMLFPGCLGLRLLISIQPSVRRIAARTLESAQGWLHRPFGRSCQCAQGLVEKSCSRSVIQDIVSIESLWRVLCGACYGNVLPVYEEVTRDIVDSIKCVREGVRICSAAIGTDC